MAQRKKRKTKPDLSVIGPGGDLKMPLGFEDALGALLQVKPKKRPAPSKRKGRVKK